MRSLKPPTWHGAYYGLRRNGSIKVQRVECTGQLSPLPLRLDLWNHSPTGFNWGYGGSGPAQLALALLCDVLGDDREAVRLHQAFKWDVVARLGDEWMLVADEIRDWVNTFEQLPAMDLSTDGSSHPVNIDRSNT
jgi:hypothetical protein